MDCNDVTKTADTGQCATSISHGVTAEDEVGAQSVTCVNDADSSPFPDPTTVNVGVESITCSATDATSHTSECFLSFELLQISLNTRFPTIGSCTISVTVTDDEAPQAVCPDDYRVFATAAGTQLHSLSDDITQTATASSDNCNFRSATSLSTDPTTLNPGPNTISMRVEDGSGNFANCNYIITLATGGACCHDGVCSSETEADCTSLNGAYAGDYNNDCLNSCGQYFCFDPFSIFIC
jgi:hypothetical protein